MIKREADLKEWGLVVKGQCRVCKAVATHMCMSSVSLVCGTPLCALCKCPTHNQYGYTQS